MPFKGDNFTIEDYKTTYDDIIQGKKFPEKVLNQYEDFATKNKLPLTENDTKAIIETRKYLSERLENGDTSSINTPERQKYRQGLIDQFYGNGGKKGKQAFIVIGLMGAGKTTHCTKLAEENNAVYLDYDTICESILDHDQEPSRLHRIVHNEAKGVIEKICERAAENDDNTVVHLSGRILDEIKTYCKMFKDKNYDVHVHFIDLPAKEAAKRAIKRFEETDEHGERMGFYVDPYAIYNRAAITRANYETLKEALPDVNFKKFSNDVPPDQPMILKDSKEKHKNIFAKIKNFFLRVI